MSQSLLILYATLTGDAEAIAKAVAAAASQRDYDPTVSDLKDYVFELHALEGRILLIAGSNHNGNPPPDADAFYTWLRSRSTPLLRVNYSVFAVGEVDHGDLFGFGRSLDAEFERLGATPIAKRAEAAPNDGAGLEAWLDAAFTGFSKTKEPCCHEPEVLLS